MIDRWKKKNMENILELHNKTPVWNDGRYSIDPAAEGEVVCRMRGRVEREKGGIIRICKKDTRIFH